MATKCKVSCPVDGDQVISVRHVLLDEEEARYRFQCPGECGSVIEKRMDAEIFDVLHNAGAPTVDELCMAFALQLEDDRKLARFIYTAP